MKLALKVVIGLMLTQIALAENGYSVRRHGCNIFGCWDVSGCAPEVQENNLFQVESVLQNLKNGDLKQAEKFKTITDRISQQEPAERISSYLKLAGISSDQEIAQFIGSRDGQINPSHIQSLAKKTDLSDTQSEMVLKQVAGALLGERK